VRARDRALVLSLLMHYVRPNIDYQESKTEEDRERARAQIENNPPKLVVNKGELLAHKGDAVSREKLDQIDMMYSAFRGTLFLRFLVIAAYASLLCGLVMQYMRSFRKDILFSTANVFLVALPVLLALVMGRLSLELVNFPRMPEASGYLFPAALIGMLTVILLDARTGILLVTLGSLAFSVATELDFKVFLTSLLGGYTAVGILTGAKERREVLIAGCIVGVINAVVMLLINLIDDPTDPKYFLLIWGLANGIMCGVLAMPALVLFEQMPGVVTDIRLLELTGLDHPLIKLLEEKAPGSYQHSLNVTKLAEAAAKAIGANYLLVRAGAYFHDVGKILKPKYFSENQISLDDKSLHSKISPYMSAMIIKNHVKAGIELAKQYHLPEKVLAFIPEHQGTTMITYFYHQAQKRFENSQSTDPVRELDFRYPGPKPQSIETAIVMLADTAEATVTSRFTSLTVNEYELQATIKKTVADKFNDGQFDECDLTLRDLHLIRESFVKTLLARFHHRVAYPTSTPAAPVGTVPMRRDRSERPAA
ncbi:TPA: hypothetical protein DDW35_03050, partial [Candidatus Sumerlaeota bacterium]|nr:hypothetical protein [Candidatus Sumerlaeota bacterium]